MHSVSKTLGLNEIGIHYLKYDQLSDGLIAQRVEDSSGIAEAIGSGLNA